MGWPVGVGGKEGRDVVKVVMNSADRKLDAAPKQLCGTEEVGEYGREFAMLLYVYTLYVHVCVCVGRVCE